VGEPEVLPITRDVGATLHGILPAFLGVGWGSGIVDKNQTQRNLGKGD